jgi:calcium/proton exchanger cax
MVNGRTTVEAGPREPGARPAGMPVRRRVTIGVVLALRGDRDPARPRRDRGRRVRRVLLGLAAGCSGLVADWFVSSLGPAIDALHAPEEFAGLVIVGIAGNAVENFNGVVFAARRQSDLAISVVIHSVNQVALLVFPILILASSMFATRLTFRLPPLYIGALGLTAIVLWQVTADGRAYLFEGLGLIAIYVIVVAFAYLA